MKLLLDEDSQAHRLINALRLAGHDVLSVADLDSNGFPDAQIFAKAQNLGRAVLTHNVADFLVLARQAGKHEGVLAVFRDGKPRNTMSYEQIVGAIAALEASGLSVQNHVHILNHWRSTTPPEGIGGTLATIGRRHGITAQDIVDVQSVSEHHPAKPMDLE